MNLRRASVLCVPVLLMATPSSSADFSSPAHRWSGCHATIQGSYDAMSVSTTYGARPGDNLDGLRATKIQTVLGLAGAWVAIGSLAIGCSVFWVTAHSPTSTNKS